ncbi:MAG: sodium:solute symporter family transporter [Aureliella sp.]
MGEVDNSGANAALIAFAGYLGIVFLLAWLSGRVKSSSSFLNDYFLGGRNLGVWAFALTFAATSASGGSFIGFPSLVYSHGWSVALWISSYMLVPLVAMGLLAKRLNQLARKTDALTIPDLLQARFRSDSVGLLATVLIVFFTTCNLVAQFKSGSIILQTLLEDVPLFQNAVASSGSLLGANSNMDAGYLLCLVTFALAVIAYTTYGGFRAVVWTDVLQGFVMVIGILILLPMTLFAVGGLKKATTALASAKPMTAVKATIALARDSDLVDSGESSSGKLLPGDRFESGTRLACRLQGKIRSIELQQSVTIDAFGRLRPSTTDLPKLQFTESAADERHGAGQGEEPSPDPASAFDSTASPLLHGLLFDGLAVGTLDRSATTPLIIEEILLPHTGFGRETYGSLTSLPGPSRDRTVGFLPMMAAVSFFAFWCFGSAGQPSNMIRCMAFRDSKTLGKAIFTVTIYFSLIYFPIVIIFCCARVLLPGWETASDRIMPEMATSVTALFQVPWLAGLLVAAPFAAVMSTMDSFLLLISSSVVRDIYVRHINPNPSKARVKVLTYSTTFVVGTLAMLAAINPPQFLQDIIVFTGAGLAAAFLVPTALALYWPRYNYQGAVAGLVGGFGSYASLYAIGYGQTGTLSPYQPLGLSPFLIGLVGALALSIVICLTTQRPGEEIQRQFFYLSHDQQESRLN